MKQDKVHQYSVICFYQTFKNEAQLYLNHTEKLKHYPYTVKRGEVKYGHTRG